MSDVETYEPLLRTQANDLFVAIGRTELARTDFVWKRWDVNEYATHPVLQHIPSGYYFTFERGPVGNWRSSYSPAKETLWETTTFSNWEEVLSSFKEWLGNLKREFEAPDLWRALAQGSELLSAASAEDSSNRPFTPEEREYIVSGLEEIKEYMITAHQVDPELVERQIKYLEDASDRLGRKDWINVLLSVVIGFILNASVTPQSALDILTFAGRVLRQILHSPFLLT